MLFAYCESRLTFLWPGAVQLMRYFLLKLKPFINVNMKTYLKQNKYEPCIPNCVSFSCCFHHPDE